MRTTKSRKRKRSLGKTSRRKTIPEHVTLDTHEIVSTQPWVRILEHDARYLTDVIENNSVDLVVTSPPYPMISMWDETFKKMDQNIPEPTDWTFEQANGIFENMHKQLDLVWSALEKCVKPGGIVVINIGDATRSIEKRFALYPNGARTTMGMVKAGFTALPNLYWKKPTNGPNAFLGSGFFPVNAYVTVDCEHLLIFRLGDKRKFPPKDPNRKKSSFSKEERNLWFSQTWSDIKGTKQKTISGRRSAAFPEEIPRRLIRMFSVIGDTVLDPFVGTGTTAFVSRSLDRNCIGLDLSKDFVKEAKSRLCL